MERRKSGGGDEIKHSKIGNEGYQKLSNNKGTLTYYFDKPNNRWEIEEINVLERYKRQGVGSNLLRSFVSRIGFDKPVHSLITHKETIDKLKERYGISMGTYTVPNEELSTLPIIKLLKKSNIDVESCIVSYKPSPSNEFEYDAYEVEVFGRTKNMQIEHKQ